MRKLDNETLTGTLNMRDCMKDAEEPMASVTPTTDRIARLSECAKEIAAMAMQSANITDSLKRQHHALKEEIKRLLEEGLGNE